MRGYSEATGLYTSHGEVIIPSSVTNSEAIIVTLIVIVSGI